MMLKRNRKIRVLALVLAMVMVLASVDIGAFAVETDSDMETVSDDFETTSGDELPNETEGETPGSTTEGSGETVAESGRPEEPDETSTESRTTETSDETEPEDESKLSETDEETSPDDDGQENVIEETMNALFVISWYDEGNVAERRPEDIRRLIEIYADGELLDDTRFDITLLNEDQDGDGKPEPDRAYGLETYYYVISNLPVYTGAKDGSEEQTKIIYTIKEDRAAIPGYKAMDTALLDSSAGELQNKMAAPGDTMLLEAYEGEGRETRNRFVNYLPEYSVSGRVVWDVEDSSYPEIESYFEDYFAVIEEDRDYVCHTVTYSKDEEKENIWNFSITGLFTTNEDGSAASYVLHPAELEWFKTTPASVPVAQDMEDVEFVYTLSDPKAAIMSVDIEDKDEERTATSYGANPNTQVVWYDTTGGDVYQHYGQLTMKVTYTVSGAEDGEDAVTRTIEPMWDPVQGGYYYCCDEEDAKALGVKASDPNNQTTWLWIWDEGANNLNRTLQAWNLPDTVTTTTTGDDGEVSTVSQSVAWSIEVTGCTATSFEYDDRVTGYSVYPNAAGNGSVLYPLQNFTLYMDVRAGYDDSSAWTDVFFKEMGLAFSCTGGDGSTSLTYDSSRDETFSSEALAEIFESYFGVTHSKEENEFISMLPDGDGDYTLTVRGLPIYDGNKREINYSIITADKKITSENADYWYTVEFDNTAVPGHGTDVSAAYNKGTVILTKTGITTYEAYKIWQDEEDENKDYIGEERPTTTWTLWHGSENGGNYVTAAQVFYDAEGHRLNVISYGYDTDGNRLADTEKTYAIEDWVTRGYTIEEFLIENLPAYDSDGYSYVYFSRESPVEDSIYARYYGSKTENGHFSDEDVLPEDYEAEERRSDDHSIYNGGAVANRKEEMTTVFATKTWVAAYYQNELENIEVDLKLQAKHKREQMSYGEDIVSDRNTWYDVKDESGEQITLTLSGFDAYNLTQTGSVEVNQYCDHGHELEYRWVEASIYEVTEEADGTKTRKPVEWFKTEANEDAFRLSVNQKTLDEESYEHSDEYFVSKTETEGNTTTITNTLEGYTEYYVKKTWEEGLTAQPIQVIIEQYDSAGTQVKTWEETLSDTTAISGESATPLAYGGNYNSMDSGWVHLFENLPKYDENGNLYTYTVREAKSPYAVYYKYGLDVDNDGVNEMNSVQIDNHQGPGVINTIDVRKVWLDDSTTTDRAACSFAVYAGTYDGDSVLLYGTVEDEEGILSPEFVVVSEDTSWWKHVDVTVFSYLDGNGKTIFLTDTQGYENIEEYTYKNGNLEKSTEVYESETEWQQAHLVKDFYITENMIGDTPVDTEEKSSQEYPTTKSGKTSYVTIYNNIADKDNYDCTDTEDSLGYYTVINRRIGVVNYIITKKWNDGMSTEKMRQEWKAALTLSCDEDKNTVQEKYIDIDGKETTLSYGYTQRPVNSQYTEDNEEFEHAVGEILAKEKYGYAPIIDNNKQQISSIQSLGNTGDNSNTEKVYYYNLPMYDVYGRLLHYSVKEDMKESITVDGGITVDCEYDISYDDVIYKVENGDLATESQTINNTLMDTEEYEWHLLWLDAYRYTTGQRPDIYLTLYYTVYEYDEAGNLKLDENKKPVYTVEPYPFTEYLWTETSDPENTKDYWTASFELPKYDANGTRITYYADISTNVNFGIIDYVESQYASGTVGNVGQFTEVDNNGNPVYNTSKVKYDPGTNSYVVDYETDSSIVNTATSSDGKPVYVLEAGNTFVNQIRKNVNINGRKVWENVPEGFPVNELPILTFNLYRLKMNTKGEYLLADGGTTTTYEESWFHEIIERNGQYVLQTSDGENNKY